MDWKRHSAIGLICSTVVLLIFRNQVNLELALTGLFVGFIFSILPDIDHQNSKITIWLLSLYTTLNLIFYFWKKEFLIYTLIIQGITLLFIRMPHRGPIHTWIAGGIFTGVFYFISLSIPLSVIAFVAYISHLVADGIPGKII